MSLALPLVLKSDGNSAGGLVCSDNRRPISRAGKTANQK